MKEAVERGADAQQHEEDRSKKSEDGSKETGEIMAADYWSLVRHARDAQKGLMTGAENALKIVKEAKDPTRTYDGRPLISYIADALKKDEEEPAHVRESKDGKVEAIEIKPDKASRDLPNLLIDVQAETVDGMNARILKQAAHDEALQYVREAVGAANRPIPEYMGELDPLTESEREMLLKVEEAAVKGDVQALVKMFQADPGNESLWSRLSAESLQDLGYPPVFEYRMTEEKNGSPYLVINNRLANQMESWDATVVLPTGNPQVLKYNDWNEIQFDQPSGRTVEEAAVETQKARLAGIGERLSEKRCDYDTWKRDGESLGKTSLKELVERYNSHRDHPCEPDEGEGDAEETGHP